MYSLISIYRRFFSKSWFKSSLSWIYFVKIENLLQNFINQRLVIREDSKQIKTLFLFYSKHAIFLHTHQQNSGFLLPCYFSTEISLITFRVLLSNFEVFLSSKFDAAQIIENVCNKMYRYSFHNRSSPSSRFIIHSHDFRCSCLLYQRNSITFSILF